MSVFSPDAIEGQPSAWAGVGASKDASNQVRVARVNLSNGSISARYQSLGTTF